MLSRFILFIVIVTLDVYLRLVSNHDFSKSARQCPCNFKNFKNSFILCHPAVYHGFFNKFQPIWSSLLASIFKHIYFIIYNQFIIKSKQKFIFIYLFFIAKNFIEWKFSAYVNNNIILSKMKIKIYQVNKK